MSCDLHTPLWVFTAPPLIPLHTLGASLHTPLWVFTAPPLIPLHTLGAYLHTPSNPAPDNRKNAPPLWQRCAFVSSFSTFAM